MQQEAFLLFIQKRMMTLSINHTYLRQHRTIRPLTSKSNSLLSIIENNAAQIRMSIEQSLSWKAQMQIVINETFE